MKHAIFFSALLLTAFSGVVAAGDSVLVSKTTKTSVAGNTGNKSALSDAANAFGAAAGNLVTAAESSVEQEVTTLQQNGTLASVYAGLGQFGSGLAAGFGVTVGVVALANHNRALRYDASIAHALGTVALLGVAYTGSYDLENGVRSLASLQPASVAPAAQYVRFMGQLVGSGLGNWTYNAVEKHMNTPVKKS